MVAMKTKNGGTIPFYRSTQGTGGKTQGKWYPFFGTNEEGDWLIKSNLRDLDTAFGIKELKDIQAKLNTLFDWNDNVDKNFTWEKAANPLIQA